MHAAALISALQGAPTSGVAPATTGEAAPSGFAALLNAALGGNTAPIAAAAPSGDVVAGAASTPTPMVAPLQPKAVPTLVGAPGSAAPALVPIPSLVGSPTPATPVSLVEAKVSATAEIPGETPLVPATAQVTTLAAGPGRNRPAQLTDTGPGCLMLVEPVAALDQDEAGQLYPEPSTGGTPVAAPALVPTVPPLTPASAPSLTQAAAPTPAAPLTKSTLLGATVVDDGLAGRAPALPKSPVEPTTAASKTSAVLAPQPAAPTGEAPGGLEVQSDTAAETLLVADGAHPDVPQAAPPQARTNVSAQLTPSNGVAQPGTGGAAPSAGLAQAPLLAEAKTPAASTAANARVEASTLPASGPAALAAVLTSPAVVSLTGERVAAPTAAAPERRVEAAKAEPSKPLNSAGSVGLGLQPTSTSTVVATAVTAPGGSGSPGGETTGTPAKPVLEVPVPAPAEGSVELAAQEPLVTEAAAHASSALAESRPAAALVRGSPETVASLAAEIARKLESRNTRFEIALDPLGLGMVNVSVDIGADGRISAQMAFERPEAAAELRGRGQELQRALEQAGFDLSKGGLSFEHGSGRERPGQDQPRGQQARAQAFQAALLAADSADTLPANPLRLRDRAGLDVRI
jgi:hypothetical protein